MAAVLLEDDFSTGTAKWQLDSNNCGTGWFLDNGMYGININHTLCSTNVVPVNWDSSVTNYIFDVDMKFGSGTDKNFVLRYENSSSWI